MSCFNKYRSIYKYYLKTFDIKKKPLNNFRCKRCRATCFYCKIRLCRRTLTRQSTLEQTYLQPQAQLLVVKDLGFSEFLGRADNGMQPAKTWTPRTLLVFLIDLTTFEPKICKKISEISTQIACLQPSLLAL